MSDATSKPNLFHRYWPVLKWALFALVIAFVGRKAWLLWIEGDVGSVTIHWPWLIASGIFYLLGWLPSVFFWHRLIHQLGGTSNRSDVTRAFFAGHLGKYVPGKASVLLIRAGLLADRGCRPGVAALTSTYETLVCMGVGAAVGLTLAPIVWPRRVIESLPAVLRPTFSHPLMFGILVVVVCVILVPVIAKLLGIIARKLTKPIPDQGPLLTNPKRERGGMPQDVPNSQSGGASALADASGYIPETHPVSTSSPPLLSPPPLNENPIQIRSSFLLLWCFTFVTTWLLHGLSLGSALRSVGVQTSLLEWLTWTGDVSSASFLGFLAIFAPGGLGVREGILIELLKDHPGISQTQAVAATVLLRGVWLAAEILATVGLGVLVRFRDRTQIAR